MTGVLAGRKLGKMAMVGKLYIILDLAQKRFMEELDISGRGRACLISKLGAH